MIPRQYQQKAHVAVRDALVAGHRRILLVAPTGAGKTFLLARLASAAVKQGKRVAWFVNRRELVSQSVAMLDRFGLEVGHSGKSPTAPVQVLTYQAAIAASEAPPADVVAFDETHHLAEKNEWAAIPQAYPGAVMLGATATPERGDGHGLDHLYQHLIVVAQANELVEVWRQSEGRQGLVPCEVLRPNRPLPAGEVARTPAKATLLHKLRDHQQVVFASHVKAAEEFADGFRQCGISVAVVTGAMPAEDRAEALAKFRAREIRVLCNVHVLTEGWDAPEVDVVTLARRFGTIGSMIQATGRGARPAPGKTRFLVLDLCGVTHELGHPFADREFSLEGEGIRGGGETGSVRIFVCGRCGFSLGETRTCERCGWTRPEPKTPKETGERLDRWGFLQKDDEDTRVGRLTRWIRQHREPHSRNAVASAIIRYTAVYGAPPRQVVGRAVANVAGRSWCDKCQHSVRESGCRCPKTVTA